MNKEMRKRLEEAAKRYADENYEVDYSEGTTSYNEGSHDGAEDGFLDGAEYGYQAKEILRIKAEKNFDTCHEYQEAFYQGQIELLDQALADFESDMNKLWEGEK